MFCKVFARLFDNVVFHYINIPRIQAFNPLIDIKFSIYDNLVPVFLFCMIQN